MKSRSGWISRRKRQSSDISPHADVWYTEHNGTGIKGFKVLKARYLLGNEQGDVITTSEGLFYRVASAIASVEILCNSEDSSWNAAFYELMADLRFRESD